MSLVRFESCTGVVGNQIHDAQSNALSLQVPGAIQRVEAAVSYVRGIANVVEPCRCYEGGYVARIADRKAYGLRSPTNGLRVRPSIAHR